VQEYCIHTENLTPCVVADIRSLYTHHEFHLARARIQLDLNNAVHFAFQLKYSDILFPVVYNPRT